MSLSAISRWITAEQDLEEKAIKYHSALNLNAQDELMQLRKEREILNKAAVFFAKQAE